MKKFLSFFALAIICAMAISCGNNSSDNASDASDSTTVAELQTGTFESIANALKNKEWATADSIANIVYSNKSNCTAEELANVGIAYFARNRRYLHWPIPLLCSCFCLSKQCWRCCRQLPILCF